MFYVHEAKYLVVHACGSTPRYGPPN